MTKLHDLAGLGQAVWFDYICRSLITSGELQALIDKGVRGVTSNPTIFDRAISGSSDYDQDLSRLGGEDKSLEQVYEALALEDIGRAADLLRPLYDATNGGDGYVSLEVNPSLAHDTDGTIADARRLFSALGRTNILIKVPATRAGIQAIDALIGEGINVNATLIFSVANYEAVARAYISGLERLESAGGDLTRSSSVASFFVSRIDTAVDRALDRVGETELQGKIAVASARIVYSRFQDIYAGQRWEVLAAQGARMQHPLWASTSTKNPAYPDTLYVDTLIGENTVNTMPPRTMEAFLDHGRVAVTVTRDLDQARALIARLPELGIDLEAITQKLQDDGVAAFAASFESLLTSVGEKRRALRQG